MYQARKLNSDVYVMIMHWTVMYMSWSCIEQWCICHDHACKRIDLTSVSTILLLDVGTVPTVECFIFQFMSSDIKFPGSDCWLLSYITSDYYPHPFNICNDHACCGIEFPLFPFDVGSVPTVRNALFFQLLLVIASYLGVVVGCCCYAKSDCYLRPLNIYQNTSLFSSCLQLTYYWLTY
jgi:hypothetical protein